MMIRLAIIALILITSCTPSVEDLVDRGIALSDKGKYREAVKVYSEIIERNRKLEVAYYNRGLCYMKLKEYKNALEDFNTLTSKHETGGFVLRLNPDGPFASEEARAQVPYYEAVYQKAQTLYHMDSGRSSYLQFSRLVENNFEKSNCLGWQGMIWLRLHDSTRACKLFEEAKQSAVSDSDKEEAEDFLKTYCK